MTSGVSAEYGRFTGGVINADHEAGRKRVQRVVPRDAEQRRLEGPDPDPAAYNSTRRPDVRGDARRADLEGQDLVLRRGPIQQERDVGRRRPSPTDEQSRSRRTNTDKRYEGKLTITPFQNHTLTGSYTNAQRWSRPTTYFTATPSSTTTASSTTGRFPRDLSRSTTTASSPPTSSSRRSTRRRRSSSRTRASRINDLIGGTRSSSRTRGYGQMWSRRSSAPSARRRRDARQRRLPRQGDVLPLDEEPRLPQHRLRVRQLRRPAASRTTGSPGATTGLLYPTSIQYNGTNLYPVIDDELLPRLLADPRAQPGERPPDRSLFVNDTWRLNNASRSTSASARTRTTRRTPRAATTANDSAFSPRSRRRTTSRATASSA